MAEGVSDSSGCLAGLGIIFGVGILIQVVIAIVTWILSWPFFLGHILLGLLATGLLALIIVGVVELLLRLIWPDQILAASDRASKALRRSLFRREGSLLEFSYVKLVDTETRKATAVFTRISKEPFAGDEEEIGDIYLSPNSNRFSRRIFALLRPAQVYLESFEKSGLSRIPDDTPDGAAWRACTEIEDEIIRLVKMHDKAQSFLSDVDKVSAMNPSNELIDGIRKRAEGARPNIEAILRKMDERGDFLASSYEKLIELISVPPSLRGLEAETALNFDIAHCKGSADDLFEEVRLFEESYSNLLEL